VNIFVLDRDIGRCARYHSDAHVVKMTLEGTQILCTVLHENGLQAPYKPTHIHHPCTLWAGESLSNWKWLRRLVVKLNDEYRYRWKNARGDHESFLVAAGLPLPPIADRGLTDFAQAMPEQYRVPGDAVRAYRRFYVAEKSSFARWTRRRRPHWFAEGLRQLKRAESEKTPGREG
jgi:hypothetical protein